MAADIDRERLEGFIDESNESLQEIETDFIALEKDPNNMEIINRIFRPVHSLKGSSGFFGLVNINKFSHRLENLLGFIRKGEIVAGKEIVDILLRGIEFLQSMLDRALIDPHDIQLRADEEEFITLVEGCKPEAVSGSIQSIVKLESCLNEALEAGICLTDHSLITNLLNTIEKSITEIKSITKNSSQPLEDIFSSDFSYYLNGIDYTEHVSVLGEVLSLVKKHVPAEFSLIKECIKKLTLFSQTFPDDCKPLSTINELSSMINFLDNDMMIHNDEYCNNLTSQFAEIISLFTGHPQEDGPERVGEILVSQKKISQEQLDGALGKQQKIGGILVEQGAIDPKDLEQALNTQSKNTLSSLAKKRETTNETTAKTIRINQANIDNFANFVGELFINIDTFNYLKKQLEQADTDFELMSKFTNAVTAFDDVVENLHESVMEIRRVPVKSLFQRFPKVDVLVKSYF